MTKDNDNENKIAENKNAENDKNSNNGNKNSNNSDNANNPANLKDAENIRHQQREAICRQCGRCCRQKFHVGDDILITDIPCEYLDTTTNRCTVYEQRLFKQPLCCAIDVAVANNAQPDDCPYVGGNSNYRTPMLLADHPEYREAVEAHFAKPKVTLAPGSHTKQAAKQRRKNRGK